jgi:hypothetical protein
LLIENNISDGISTPFHRDRFPKRRSNPCSISTGNFLAYVKGCHSSHAGLWMQDVPDASAAQRNPIVIDPANVAEIVDKA